MKYVLPPSPFPFPSELHVPRVDVLTLACVPSFFCCCSKPLWVAVGLGQIGFANGTGSAHVLTKGGEQATICFGDAEQIKDRLIFVASATLRA